MILFPDKFSKLWKHLHAQLWLVLRGSGLFHSVERTRNKCWVMILQYSLISVMAFRVESCWIYHFCDGGHIQVHVNKGRGFPFRHGPQGRHLNVIIAQAEIFNKRLITAVSSSRRRPCTDHTQVSQLQSENITFQHSSFCKCTSQLLRPFW